MAIQQRTVNGSFTEIYINGGGDMYLTQSYPTNFHGFWTKKILTEAESIADYMEVTAAERAKLEAADAQWERPEQALIDRWNEACYVHFGNGQGNKHGQYNESTGFFEFGSQVFTTAEAVQSLRVPPMILSSSGGYHAWSIRRCPAFFEAYFPTNNTTNVDHSFMWVGAKVLRITSYNGVNWANSGTNNITNGTNLVEIICTFRMQDSSCTMFNYCPKLEIVDINGLKANFTISGAPKLNLNSFRNMIDNAANTAEITITVHADIYSALQGEASEYPFNGGSRQEWEQLLADAVGKQINFASD